MNAELRKRIEEAAEKAINCDVCPIGCWKKNCKSTCSARTNVIIGAELGYKEAIEQAKEWLAINTEEYAKIIDGKEYVEREQLLDDFETDMNEL